MNWMKRQLPVWVGAVALSLSGASSFTYAADAKDAAKEAAKAQKREAERERKAEKREQAEFKKFPDKARATLTKELQGASDIDYYRLKEGDTRVYGALFKTAKGETMDIRVDKEGTVLSRLHSDVATVAAANQAAAAAPAVAAPVAPTPVTPATPTPTAPDARRDPAALTLAEMPAAVRSVIEQQSKGAHDVHYYRAKFGTQDVYEVKYTTADDKDMAVRVDNTGKIVDSRQLNKDEVASKRDPAALTLAEMPAAVRSVAQQQTKGAHDIDYYRAKFGTQDVYEVKYTTADDKDMAVRIDSTGKIVDSRQLNKDEAAKRDAAALSFSELPKAVQTAMEKQTKGGKDVHYYRAKFGTQDVYEVKYETSGGKEMAVRVDNSGKVVDSRELPAKPTKATK